MAGSPTSFADQHGAIRKEFAQQAAGWGQDAIDADLLWAVDRLAPRIENRVLDVAAGSGLLSRALAPRVHSVVAIDLTPEMLAEGRYCAAREGLTNIRFDECAAEALPYADGAFDLVVTRFSIHHFQDPAIVAAEMVRVMRPGGRIGVIDMVSPEEADAAARHNALEKLRDPTHTRALSGSELTDLVERAGTLVEEVSNRDVSNELFPWLERSRTPEGARRAILAAFDAELAGGAPTGMRPYSEVGTRRFLHLWQVVTAQKPAARG